MTDRKEFDDAELDGLFQAARHAAPLPSDALLARITADADAELPRPPVSRSAMVGGSDSGAFAGLMAAIGGWPSAAGLAGAAVVGLMVGYAAPDALDGLSAGLFPSTDYWIEDMMPSYGDLAVDG